MSSPGGAVIVGFGAVTAVGATAKETAASVRSATSRFSETPLRDRVFRPITLGVVPDDVLPPVNPKAAQIDGLTSRMLRMLRLATPALTEAAAVVPGHAPRPGLILAVPETETALPFDASRFLAGLRQQAGDFFDATYASASGTGRSGGLLAIGEAAALVDSSRVPLMLAGGIDTYRDPFVLSTLDGERRLKTASNLDGFIPGEGAAFVLIANRRRAADYGLAPLASLSPSVSGIEVGHLYSSEPYRGDGLATTLRELFGQIGPSEPIPEVFSSMNGESHWAKEWSVAFLRNRSSFVEAHGIHHPADCYGDIGAATGPALVTMAIMGINAGYRQSPALIYASSDRGARAAILLRKAPV